MAFISEYTSHLVYTVYIGYVTWCQMHCLAQPPEPLLPEQPPADRLTQGSRHKMLEIYNTVKSVQFNTADISVRFLQLVYSMVKGIEEGRAAGKSPH